MQVPWAVVVGSAGTLRRPANLREDNELRLGNNLPRRRKGQHFGRRSTRIWSSCMR